ncbi:hypothetical protein SNEBB_001268 [Seison nebaliae]|nr:hypothetical protein SNEBB_001268 [Seison nebaliae]
MKSLKLYFIPFILYFSFHYLSTITATSLKEEIKERTFLKYFLPLSSSSKIVRKVTFNVNKGCQTCDKPYLNTTEYESYVNVIHSIATGENDTIHVFWSTVGAVSCLMVQTTNNAEIAIDWDEFLLPLYEPTVKYADGSIKLISGEIIDSFGFIWTNFYEYDDKDDKAVLPVDKTVYRTIPTGEFYWNNFIGKVDYNNYGTISTSSLNLFASQTSNQTNSQIKLNIEVDGQLRRMVELPHLLNTDSSTISDLEIIDFPIKWNNSRFALEFDILRPANCKDINFVKKRSLDDEYTPGTFTMDSVKSKDDMFFQWKPVTYTYQKRSVNNISQTRSYDLRREESTFDKSIPYSLVRSFYYDNDAIFDGCKMSINISIGQPHDHFYAYSNYTTFTFLFGFGKEPLDRFSVLVISMVTVGLGLPLIIFVFGGIYMKVTKKKDELYNG